MTERAQALIREALKLPSEERADVAAQPLASLDEPEAVDAAAVQAARATQIEGRARRVLAGESAGEPWEDARDRISRSLTASPHAWPLISNP